MRSTKFLDELYRDEFAQRLKGTPVQYSVFTEVGTTFIVDANSCDSLRQFHYSVLDAYNKQHPSWQARFRDLTIKITVTGMAPNHSLIHLAVAARSISSDEQSLLNAIYSPAEVNHALADFDRANLMLRRSVPEGIDVNRVLGEYENVINRLSLLVYDLQKHAGVEEKSNSYGGLYLKYKEMHDDLRLKLIEVHTGSLRKQSLNHPLFAHLPSEKLENIVLAYASFPTMISAYKNTGEVVRNYQRYILSHIMLNQHVLPLPSVLSNMALEYYGLPGVGQFQSGATALSDLSLFSAPLDRPNEVLDLSPRGRLDLLGPE